VPSTNAVMYDNVRYSGCVGMFGYAFLATLPVSLLVRVFWDRLTFGEVVGGSFVSFLIHGVCCILRFVSSLWPLLPDKLID